MIVVSPVNYPDPDPGLWPKRLGDERLGLKRLGAVTSRAETS